MSSLKPEQQQHVALDLLNYLRNMYSLRASITTWGTSNDWMVELVGKGLKFQDRTITEEPIVAVLEAAMAHSSRTTHSACILKAHRSFETMLETAKDNSAPPGTLTLIKEFSRQLQADLSILEIED